ncbi:hypothetical protein AAL_00633 [Moelleriella libera RCEF 2490]|uniref:Uncharacterized protein n=1 Tax=Moelleriella libera RCEF 2490 TaxID=1081109 RepID=A0A166V0I2_9HYPO|nr:hypothetical protein AAL_00633 [Moelleriella libera RCEF 2490]
MATGPPSSGSSSPTSYYTANNSNIEGSTTASSPVQAVPCAYRDARTFPDELKKHGQIFMEEQLYSCAISLLNSVLGAGMSRSRPLSRPALVPPPSHLAVLCSLMIHPAFTTQAQNPEQRDAASMSLDYLRNVLTLVGPMNAGFATAFQFQDLPRCRWGRRSAVAYATSAGSDSDMSDGDADRDHDRLHGDMANERGLWNRGQDLWNTVGWAFNTSTLHPFRWRYWKIWLDFMLVVLEADWDEREALDEAAYEARGGHGGEVPTASRQNAMMAAYIYQGAVGGHVALRPIIKALFADGSTLYAATFPEIFDKETRKPKKKPLKKRKREQEVDLENDKFGDYFDDESVSSDVSESVAPQKRQRAAAVTVHGHATAKTTETLGSCSPGFVESITHRLRLFRLLSAAMDALGRPSDLDRLYEEFALCIKGLRLEVFALFVTQRDNPLLPEVHVTLIKSLFDQLLPTSPRSENKPRNVDPEGDEEGRLSQKLLEHCYVCLPANTVIVEDNAKLSLLVEDAIQLLWLSDELTYTAGFEAACERGIREREEKVSGRRRRKVRADPQNNDKTDEVLAQEMLDASAERIRVLVEALKTTSSV